MDRNELLKFMKSRISKYYYEILELWIKEDNKVSANTKFKIEATPFETGYIVNSKNWWSSDHIFVYM